MVASRQANRPLPISLEVRRMLKKTSGLHKLMSIVHRMSMKLESEFCKSRPRLFRGTKVCGMLVTPPSRCISQSVHLRE